MAKKTVVTVQDDLNGNEGAQTIQFGLDGVALEIDLDEKNEAKLRKALDLFVTKARKAPVQPQAGKGRPRTAQSRKNSAAIREWAKLHGIPVNERGRIPQIVIDQYEAREIG